MINKMKISMEIFLIRAIIDWAVAAKLTPCIAVQSDKHIAGILRTDKDTLVFNVHPNCVRNFLMYDSKLSFSTTINGVSHAIKLPISAMRAVYARENGLGVSLNRVNALKKMAPRIGFDGVPRLRIVK